MTSSTAYFVGGRRVNCAHNNEYRGRDLRQQSAAVDPVAIVPSTYIPIIFIQYDVLSYLVSSSCVVVVWVYNKDTATLWSCVWSMSMTPLPETRRLRRIRQMLTTLICCSGVLCYCDTYSHIIIYNNNIMYTAAGMLSPATGPSVTCPRDGTIMTLLSSVCVCVCVYNDELCIRTFGYTYYTSCVCVCV